MVQRQKWDGESAVWWAAVSDYVFTQGHVEMRGSITHVHIALIRMMKKVLQNILQKHQAFCKNVFTYILALNS